MNGDGPWDVVVYGVALNQLDGQSRAVQMGWRASGDGGAWFLECGGRRLCDEGLPAAEMARYTVLIFAPDGGGGQPVAVADPVNIDGSPRAHSLVDRLARRWCEPEAMAAD